MIDHNSIGEGFDPTTLAFYAKEAPIYAASGKAGEFRLLTEFLDRLKPGASILELGCGRRARRSVHAVTRFSC
jgi:cyclopropane fatty-acyl-phospholipid synthase-like methyltransferase